MCKLHNEPPGDYAAKGKHHRNFTSTKLVAEGLYALLDLTAAEQDLVNVTECQNKAPKEEPVSHCKLAPRSLLAV